MKRFKPLPGLVALSALVICNTGYAQSKNQKDALHPPPANIKIDGSLTDWGDSLRYFNAEKKLNYSIAADKDNIYMAIRLNDYSEQNRVLGAGLTWTINTKGKKSNMFSLTFPFTDHQGAFGTGMHHPDADHATTEDRDQLRKDRLTKLRNIKVTGFKTLEEEVITTSNTYGIKAAIDYDDDGYLVYEAAIPLKLLGDFKPDKNPWYFNLKINGVSKSTEGHEGGSGYRSGGGMGGRGRGGMGGGGMRHGGEMGGQHGSTGDDHSELFKSIDFWEKYYLYQ